MSDDRILFTRRDFLRSAALASLAVAMPTFLTDTVAAALAPGSAIPGFKDDRILVVFQLGGGNDGLNTVVPYTSDAYYRGRKTLALKKDAILKLNDEVALNSSLAPLKQIFDGGGLAVINGVGYPNPDRSHFRSMEIWHTAVDSDRASSSGWIGRYFDNCCQGKPDPLAGVTIGAEMPQAFGGVSGAGVAFADPAKFRWVEGQGADRRLNFETMNKMGGHGHDHDGHQTIDFLRNTTANAVISSDRVINASKMKRQAVAYPGNRYSGNVKHVADMIAAGLPTRIYYTSIGGFDTHVNQLGQHDNLLKQFAETLAAFTKDLKAIGVADRVQMMCFSEFGRRVEENASRGTDHGTAGPMFVLGAGITPGVHGKYPDLEDLDNGDLKHTVDFRSVYGEVLTKWLGGDVTKVLGKEFDPVGVVKG